MARKILTCKELGNEDCKKKFTGYNPGEVLTKITQHIMWDHKVEKVTAEDRKRILSMIRDDESAPKEG
jgi:predicted small metal-binding protein